MQPSVASEPVRKQLDRILSSAAFVRNQRLSRFLRFVVQQALDGKTDEVKESLIGIEVFGRVPGYDTRSDSVVRTEAAKLRVRLTEYYASDGASDPVIIELPKGGYTPVFHEGQAVQEIAAIASEAAPQRRRKWRWVLAAFAGASLLPATIGLWRFAHQSALIPIAVLPLENTSHDTANDYFVDGLTDELIRNLSIIEGLAVRSRTSSFGMKGRPRNIREAGQQLQADYLLEGSVLRAGQQLRIEVQLIRARDDFVVWSDKFNRELTDVFAIQDEIALGVANKLRLKLGRDRRRYETTAEAYDLYMRARALPDQRAKRPAMEAATLYQQVIAKDPLFAPAYAGLAAAYAAKSAQGDDIDHGEELARMRTAAERAIQLDPLLPEAHQALAMEYARDGQWTTAEASFRRAIDLDPNNSEAYCDLTMYVLLPLGRIAEALREMRIAEETDPLSPSLVQDILAWALLFSGRYDEAVGHCQKSIRATECLARARLGQGRIEEAIQILTGFPDTRYLGYAYALAGRREEAEKIAAEVGPEAFSRALIFAGLGDKERTLEALDRVAQLGAVRVGRALNSPEFSLLRGDPRVSALRKKVGLPQ
jgi:serine/threonine-protein kinase